MLCLYKLSHENKHSLALVAHMLAQLDRLHLRITLVAQRPILIANETTIRQLLVAQLTIETVRMPASRHRLDHTANNELAAFIAARREQHLEIAFAVFSSFELVEDAILKAAEALRTSGGFTFKFF